VRERNTVFLSGGGEGQKDLAGSFGGGGHETVDGKQKSSDLTRASCQRLGSAEVQDIRLFPDRIRT
jgi:hypothetical protein